MGELCLCGAQREFGVCCGPYLAGDALAPTAEALMRSRYSAYCKGNIDYLMATHHPTQRKDSDRQRLHKSTNSTQWLNLVVLNTKKGTKKDTTGTVEFACAYRPKALPRTLLAIVNTEADAGDVRSQIQQMHERSKFVKEGGQWLYTTGDMLPPYRPKKSQPCWCGSRKKFKHCHG